jgi:hypothetical protein
MPKFSSVDVLFTRTPEGWTFNAPYPRFFSRPSTYLLTDAEKATLEQRLGRSVLILQSVSLMMVMASAVLMSFWVPHLMDGLDAGSLDAWLLFFLLVIVLAIALIPAIFFVRHRVVQSVLCAARRIGPAQPDWLGFIILKKVIRRYTERKSAKALIIWSGLLLLFSTYNSIVYALVVPARSVRCFLGSSSRGWQPYGTRRCSRSS